MLEYRKDTQEPTIWTLHEKNDRGASNIPKREKRRNISAPTPPLYRFAYANLKTPIPKMLTRLISSTSVHIPLPFSLQTNAWICISSIIIITLMLLSILNPSS